MRFRHILFQALIVPVAYQQGLVVDGLSLSSTAAIDAGSSSQQEIQTLSNAYHREDVDISLEEYMDDDDDNMSYPEGPLDPESEGLLYDDTNLRTDDDDTNDWALQESTTSRMLGVDDLRDLSENTRPLPFALNNNNATTLNAGSGRELSPTSAKLGIFLPLECNANLADAPCIGLEENIPAGTNDPLVVPCGVCYVYDLGNDVDLTLEGGIHIKGLLKFPPTVRNVGITTTSIILEGELDISTDATTISPENESVTFTIVGDDNVFFVPDDAPNKGKCNNSSCKLGEKPFFVAGGKINIRGFPLDSSGTCTTHTPILDKIEANLVPDPSKFPVYSPLLPGCPVTDSEIDYIRYDFDDEESYGNWTGYWGGYANVEDNALKITNRKRQKQGPHLDITELNPGLCFTPDQTILFSTRIKLDMADGSLDGLPTTCKNSIEDKYGLLCPHFGSKIQGVQDSEWHHSTGSRLYKYRAPNYGEWFDWTGTFSWDADELNPDNAYALLYMYYVDAGVDFSVDTFRISLPSSASFPNPENLCGELVPNGDAEANGFHPYPLKSYRFDDTLYVQSEDNNQFFRMADRKYASSSFNYGLNTECLQTGVKYLASVKVRIHSEFDTPYYFYVRYSSTSRTIISCPGKRLSDGWVTCSSEFTVNEAMAAASDVDLRFHISGSKNLDVTVDWDDISITHIGYVDKLVVNAADAQCWGVGSEIYVGTSTYYSFRSQIENSYSTIIESISDNGDGTVNIGLDVPPQIPIISKAEDEDFAADLALLSRNFKIKSGTEEENKGAFLQVLHTPDVAQVVEGVDFDGMGRRGEEDRYPFQLLYSGSVDGTIFGKNTIRRSNMRCIAIQGTSNAVISYNVATQNYGHCVYIGNESQGNTIEGNYVSDTKRTSRNDRVDLESDDTPAAFRTRYGPNNYRSNIAVASRYSGFHFYHSSQTYFENHTKGSPSARQLPMGEFSHNEAKSNGDRGMVFENYELSDTVVFSNLKSIKNRYDGLLLYNIGRAIIRESLFAENPKYNVELRYSDDIEMIDTDIKGISAATKYLHHPSYFSKPCISNGYTPDSPTGLIMQTKLYRWNGSYSDGTPRLNRGAKLTNVNFSLFDQTDECSDSVPIKFNTYNGIDDGHWNYLSSFTNVRFDGNKMFNGQDANEAGVPDIVISDIDGTSDPSQQSTGPGSFVSNKRYLTSFARGDCNLYDNDISYCRDACYRTVQLRVDQTESGDYDLRVTREEDGIQVFLKDAFMYEGQTNRTNYHNYYRKFSASLPYGDYKLEFFHNGSPIWPRYAYEVWEAAPDCEGSVIINSAKVVEPELIGGECDDMVANGDMEEGLKGWLHSNTEIDGSNGYLEALEGAGIGGSTAIGVYNRKHDNFGLGTNLDTRCFHQNKLAFYEVKAWFRLEDSGDVVFCDRYTSSYPLRCPSMTLRNARYIDPETKAELDWDYDTGIAKVATPTDKEFNLLHGVIEIGHKYNVIQHATLYIEYFDESFDIVVDDFSVTKMESACFGNFFRNGDFTVGDSRFWRADGTAKYEVVGDALRVYDRGSSSNGIEQSLYVDLDCVNEFDRFLVRATYRLEDINGDSFDCDLREDDGGLTECAHMRFYAKKDSDNNGYPEIAKTVASHPSVSGGWTTMAGIFTFKDVDASHDFMYVELEGPHKESAMIFDSVVMEPLPKTCNQIVVNPSFDDGSTSYWYRSSTSVDTTVWQNDDATNYAMTFKYNGSSSTSRSYLKQRLDHRCFVDGQEFVLSAKFQLLNAADPTETLSCDPSEDSSSSADLCPVLYFEGELCDGDNFNVRLENQQQVPWDTTDFNVFQYDIFVDANIASCKKLQLEVGRYVHVDRILVVDDIMITQKTTFAPTANPTFSPTKPLTTGPTPKPAITTYAPTTSVTIKCPPPSEYTPVDAGSAIFSIAGDDSLCTITKVILKDGAVEKVLPMARSYDFNDWEVSAGSFAHAAFGSTEFLCYDSGCQINLPALEDGAEYRVSSSAYELSPIHEHARFLETASFGITESSLDVLGASAAINGSSGAISEHIQLQMQTDMSSHRAFWRKRVNPRHPIAKDAGISNHPCYTFSRWRSFTFDRNDIDGDYEPHYLNVIGSGPYALYLNGSFRTVVDDFWLTKPEGYSFDSEFDYPICASYTQEWIGGYLAIQVESGECVIVENPRVSITGFEASVTGYVLDLPNTLIPIDEKATNGEELTLPDGLDDSKCVLIPVVRETLSDEPIFGKLPDGSYLQFDPRLDFKSNTLDSPIPDGGKSIEFVSAGKSYCTNVPRNFLNEDTCVVSSNACKPSSTSSDIEILLEDDTLISLYNLTSRYVYSIQGLNVVDQYMDMGQEFPEKLPHPCTASLRSRWFRKEVSECMVTDIYSDTNETLSELLSDDSDENPYMRDIYFPETAQCNATDTDPAIEIIVGETCWERVHHDYLSIYDMTYWVTRHPGLGYHITKWAEDFGSANLIFPNGHPVNNHPMYRWQDNKHKFSYIGRYGDTMKLRDLPNDLRTEDVNGFYQDDGDIDTSGVLVCGSPEEVENDKSLGTVFDISNHFQTTYWNPSNNKKSVWLMTALDAPDQLRQRVAWGLAQILVVVQSAIRQAEDRAEWFLSFYDIFLRNAFGNYRDILKEISYNPLMAENLSFLDSKSSAYVWEHSRVKAQADENFAREIMQLFSMGLNRLNMDGSEELNEDGDTTLAYTNDDIMSLSRAWTGFRLQSRRGNIEYGHYNRIDPMKIEPSWRDKFPKSDTTGGYIGDYYPLCEDLPDKAFLNEGATYRFLGSSNLPELMEDPNVYETDETTVRAVLDQGSVLREQLCNPDESGTCRFLNTVTLSSSIDTCVGVECNVNSIRVVQVDQRAFYEYVRAPCVNQAFFNGAKKINPVKSIYRAMCGNPNLIEASGACCSFGKTTADQVSRYDGERLPYESAKERCNDESQFLCNFSEVNDYYNEKDLFFWTPSDCQIRMKINGAGMVTVVHQPYDGSTRVYHLDEDNENWFKVYWKDDSYPKAANGCDGLCDVIDGHTCLCGTSVSKGRGFRSAPSSVDDLLEILFIGAFDPQISDPESYSSTVDPTTGITTHLKNGVFDSTTIFEINDDKGRHYFVKNSIETVNLISVDDGFSGYSFRNAPHFMSFVPPETTMRDAQFETEATLDHYFYHDNTAPFLSMRMIQRLVSSNPSPRFIKTVATAFRSGWYESLDGKLFGSGSYGDMAAMFAAIYLDREPRSVVLDADPSSGTIREPLLKVVAVLRSMNFQTDYPVIRLSQMKDTIGQMVHDFESVFSFFLPEFVPYGSVGDATLVSPEATLLDMPRVVGMLNGLTSLAKFGLSSCEGGFGHDCSERAYRPSPYGVLEFKRTPSDAEFSFETFGGPSLTGGFDNTWSGKDFYTYEGSVTTDPHDTSNYVYRPVHHSSGHRSARMYSQPITRSDNVVVKFRYLGTNGSQSGGCIGFSEADLLSTDSFMFCDGSSSGQNQMTSDNTWISCQFEVPPEFDRYRIALANRRYIEDAYFDDIQLGAGSGSFCHSAETPVTIEDKIPPGEVGHSETVVDELATLLTAGRLSERNRKIISAAYDRSGGSANDGLRIAQELIFTSSEFHTTNFAVPNDNEREVLAFPSPTGKPYKAVVYVMFSGGCDSYNLLMPYSCPSSTFNSFKDIRANVAIPKNNLLPISTDNQVCSKFGIHPNMPAVRNFYNDGDLLFFANTGVMTRPVDKSNYQSLTKTQLYSHNFQQRESKRVDPYDTASGTGVLGRMSDVLGRKGHNIGSFSVDRFSVAVVGTPGETEAPLIVSRSGIPSTYLNEIEDLLGDLHNNTDSEHSFFAETWSEELLKALNTNSLLGKELEDIETITDFPTSYLSAQFKIVSKLMQTRESRGVDTDTFYVEMSAFDTHADVEENLIKLFTSVNEGYEAFASELKATDLWDNVVTIQTSDFGRTLAPNSGGGTDHAWAGNYMMMGGSVKGGQVAGTYPDDFTEDAPLNLGRGRMLPTTSWDAVFKSIATWLEISESDMKEVLPNIENFDGDHLFNANDLFEGVPEPVPTTSPSSSPIKEPSSGPTDKPSRITEEPSLGPSLSSSPSANPVGTSTSQPTNIPSTHPSIKPSGQPSTTISSQPTLTPSKEPSSQPSLTPSKEPSSAPSSKPVATSSSQPSSAPIACNERPDNEFFLGMRNDQPFYKTCEWLSSKTPDIIELRCQKTAWYASDGGDIGPPQVVCPVTCGKCTPPVTASPSSNPSASCSQNDADKYFSKVRSSDGKTILITCKKLSSYSSSKIIRKCKKTASKDGFGPAREVCRVTCETC
eukprot:CAMPEP_0194077066 /NCGR_PEP_ID=MMETSP0149-20130528/3732_1 /TAXON_ID=122233 /ORGANISM="Chaetoceros debilis, Strain MM31A-1" /LENGTH=4275 /DNA_ID=CAMNT_0038757959 /DNA_START=113 /DNA_END=12940 /DNA_ORIENTATION=+